MTLSVIVRRRATDELNEAYSWYEAEHQGLGERFLVDFKQTVLSAQTFPQSFIRVNDMVRRANLNRFPYAVFYKIESKRIVVLAVVHHARNPNLWPLPTKRAR